MIELAHVIFDQHRQIMRPAHQVGGLARPLQTAGIDRVNGLAAELGGDLFCLADAYLVQAAIRGTLAAALKIPVRSPMAKQDDLHRCNTGVKFLPERRN
jgi:hypothetical protein